MAMPGLNDLLEIPAQAPTKGTIEILIKLNSLITNTNMCIHTHAHTYVAIPLASSLSYTCEDNCNTVGCKD